MVDSRCTDNALHGCDGSKPIRKPAYMSNAVSPNRRSSIKSYSSTSSQTANNIQDLKNVEDGNDDFNIVHDDGIRVYSQLFDDHTESDVSYCVYLKKTEASSCLSSFD